MPNIRLDKGFGTADALALIHAGASPARVWTGFVYEGARLVRRTSIALRSAPRQAWTQHRGTSQALVRTK